MSLKLAKFIIRTVILIMTFECISAVMAPAHDHSYHAAIVKKSEASSLFSYLVFEKAEEEERSEEESDKTLQVILVDFSKVVFQLSVAHSQHGHYTAEEQRSDSEPSLFTLFCTYLI